MEALQITNSDLLEVDRELSRRSLVEFIRLAWPVLEPARRFVPNWHIDAIAEHLEAVTHGHIKRLLINVPPGMMKSLSVRVFFPCWEWGSQDLSHFRYVGASYRQDLAIRDNIKARRLVLSPWFQSLWPMTLMEDQDNKVKFENDNTGYQAAMPANSMTGERGDRIILDDPHSVDGALSTIERKSAIQWFSETVPTRLNDPDKSAIIVIMQRLHEDDVSGYILSSDLGYEHLCLPMEYEPERKCMTSIGFEDPRKEPDELLFVERFPRSAVDGEKKALGTMATAGQFQQRPAPRGGGMIKSEKFQIGVPGRILRSVRYWDKAGTEGGGAFTAGVLMGVDEDGLYWIMDVERGQWSALKREKIIQQTAELDGVGVSIYHEQEPGSGGKESAEATTRNLAGYVVRADRVTGEKVLRAEPFATQVEAGNVRLKKGAWNREFIEEAKVYPVGKFKDQIDSAAGAFNKLALVRRWLPAQGSKDRIDAPPPPKDNFIPVSGVLH